MSKMPAPKTSCARCQFWCAPPTDSAYLAEVAYPCRAPLPPPPHPLPAALRWEKREMRPNEGYGCPTFIPNGRQVVIVL